ncbi:MAG: hypothetical protein ACFB21_03330, partial [Opitutales bacterium]
RNAGLNEAAMEHLEIYLEEQPRDVVNRRLLADMLMESGNLPAAYEARQTAARYASRVSAEEHLRLGRLALTLNRAPAAEGHYNDALSAAETDEARALAHLGLLETHLRQRDWAAAYEELTVLREDHPRALAESRLVADRPQLEASLDQWNAQQQAAEQSQSLASATEPEGPSRPDAVPRPEPEEAQETSATPADRPETTELAAPVEQGSATNEAETTVPERETSPGSSPGTIIIGDRPYTADLERQAEAAQRQAEAIGEASPAARARRLAETAREAFEADDFGEASRLYRRALSLDAEQASYAYGASRADFERGRFEDAEIMANEAMRLHRAAASREGFDEQPRYTLHYLRTIQRTRPSHTVLVELFEARRRFPQDPTLTLSLAEAFERLQTGSNEAEALYKEFLRLAPDHPRAPEIRERLEQN